MTRSFKRLTANQPSSGRHLTYSGSLLSGHCHIRDSTPKHSALRKTHQLSAAPAIADHAVACRISLRFSSRRKRYCIAARQCSARRASCRFASVCRACRRMTATSYRARRFESRRFPAGPAATFPALLANTRDRSSRTGLSHRRRSIVFSRWLLHYVQPAWVGRVTRPRTHGASSAMTGRAKDSGGG